jgi:hypothetical protein
VADGRRLRVLRRPPCNWPQPGSNGIDINEIMGGVLTATHQSLHCGWSKFTSIPAGLGDVSPNFHTYELD